MKVTKIGIDIYGHYIYGGGAELAFISDIQENIGLLITLHTDVNITTPYKFNFSAENHLMLKQFMTSKEEVQV